MKEFLIWLKENHWQLYKDGTWYTTKERPYMNGLQRKFYTEDQVIEIYNKTK